MKKERGAAIEAFLFAIGSVIFVVLFIYLVCLGINKIIQKCNKSKVT